MPDGPPQLQPEHSAVNRSVAFALLAAALFGASTPLAKLLVGEISPVALSSLLYLGSGLGLGLIRLGRDRGWRASGLTAGEWPWLLGAIAFGGVIAPIALMVGLSQTSAANASLLLNLETVLTAVIAWLVFRENADRRIVLGMLSIVLGGLLLSWPGIASVGGASGSGAGAVGGFDRGAAAIALACLCWAIDNNLTRKISASDALFIAGCKGVIAGLVNGLIAWRLGAVLPSATFILSAGALGFVCYGISLVLFVLALRGLGAARTGAYFSTAPFVGAAIALLMPGEPVPPAFWIAATLMGVGIWLHLTEHHEHEHQHEMLEHEHSHQHDEHHQHEHEGGQTVEQTHSHWHTHPQSVHRHAHAPDIHHQHGHSRSLARR
jgi:drug/metabolite transporter (DMT)-like permease